MVGAKTPTLKDTPIGENFHAPPGVSAPIEPLLLYQPLRTKNAVTGSILFTSG